MGVTLLIGIAVGLGLARWAGFSDGPIVDRHFVADGLATQSRLSELETLLSNDRYERQKLSAQFWDLVNFMEELPMSVIGREERFGSDSLRRPAARSFEGERSVPATVGSSSPLSSRPAPRPEALDQIIRQQQFDRFVAVGIAPGRAQLIMQREEHLEMEALRARFDATQSGATPQEVANITPMGLLRSELGDVDYAKYLEARGRPTSTIVRRVLDGSPAEIAGLQLGDEVVAYDGQRVFDMNELTALSYEAQVGTTVPLQVVRDGQSLQVYVEAGPIGISGGGRP